jgi:hypothetical protein
MATERATISTVRDFRFIASRISIGAGGGDPLER